MVNIFDAFNDRAKEVIYSARDFANYYRNNFVGTEHLLLGVLKNKGKVLDKTLAALNITEENIKDELKRFIQEGAQKELYGDDDFLPGAKMTLRLSFEEANELSHQYVGPEHIFLGLLREGESVAYRVLTNLGIDIDTARSKVREYTRSSEDGSSKKSEEEEFLSRFTNNLIEMAKQNKLDPVIGREKEIERVIHILSRRRKNNPALVGDPGVGKTAIVEGLALRIVQNSVPDILRDKIILSLDMSAVLAGAKYMGEFEERLKKLMDILTKRDNVILFIDEIHTIIGAGRNGGAMDAANILKPALARGELQCIGATTVEEYRKYIEKDAALERRFQPVVVEEPSIEDTIKILNGIKDKYEAYHRVKITDEAIEAAANLSARYIADRFLPDKAVDLIDEAAAKVRLNKLIVPNDLAELERQLHSIRVEKESAFNDGDYEKVATLGVEEKKLEEEYKRKKKEWEDQKAKEQRDNVVRKDDIAEIISRWSGVPVTKLTEEESQRYLKLEEELHKRVVGQNEAIEVVSDVVRASRAGLTDPTRPNGVFLFLGPTGVGKTEVAKALTEALYGDEELLIRLDMTEYMEKHSVAKLIGAPPGYVGYDEGGQLTEQVRRKPYSVILLDEVEKAHPDIFNILLQIFDDGRLTDAKGRTVNFKNTIIIMTSNIGADIIMEKTSKNEPIENEIEQLLKHYFKPEFLNRIDETVIFKSLKKEEIRKIVELQLEKINTRLSEKKIELKASDKLMDYLADIGYDPSMGARPLKRVMSRYIVNRISKAIIEGEVKEGDKILLDLKGSDIVIVK